MWVQPRLCRSQRSSPTRETGTETDSSNLMSPKAWAMDQPDCEVHPPSRQRLPPHWLVTQPWSLHTACAHTRQVSALKLSTAVLCAVSSSAVSRCYTSSIQPNHTALTKKDIPCDQFPWSLFLATSGNQFWKLLIFPLFSFCAPCTGRSLCPGIVLGRLLCWLLALQEGYGSSRSLILHCHCQQPAHSSGVRLNLTSELQGKKGTSLGFASHQEKENGRFLLVLGEASKPGMDTGHWTSQSPLSIAAPVTPPVASPTAHVLCSQCQVASLLQLQTNPSWFRPQRENFKVNCGQTTILPSMRGHEGAVETQHCTVFEMIERSEHLDCWAWTTGPWDFLNKI